MFNHFLSHFTCFFRLILEHPRFLCGFRFGIALLVNGASRLPSAEPTSATSTVSLRLKRGAAVECRENAKKVENHVIV